jgi:hypothetical protein
MGLYNQAGLLNLAGILFKSNENIEIMWHTDFRNLIYIQNIIKFRGTRVEKNYWRPQWSMICTLPISTKFAKKSTVGPLHADLLSLESHNKFDKSA